MLNINNNRSKDNTIKFWDIVSGLCIRTISSHLGEVTSVEMNSSGTYLLSSSKDNSNRLWDVRMVSYRKFAISFLSFFFLTYIYALFFFIIINYPFLYTKTRYDPYKN